MTGTELNTFVQNLLDGETLDETFFYALLNIAKAKIEAERPWRILIKEDNSNNVLQSNTFDFLTAGRRYYKHLIY